MYRQKNLAPQNWNKRKGSFWNIPVNLRSKFLYSNLNQKKRNYFFHFCPSSLKWVKAKKMQIIILDDSRGPLDDTYLSNYWLTFYTVYQNPELPEAPPITIAVLINYDMADCVYCEILSEISHSTLLTILWQ